MSCSLGQIKLKYPNLHVLENQIVNWGLWSIVEVHLNAIRYLLKLQAPWKFFINLSGQDFPLKPQSFIRDYLSNKADYNFINIQTEFEFPAIRLRQKKYFEEVGTKSFISQDDRASFESHFHFPIGLYGGSNWMILNREFCEYLLSSKILDLLAAYFRHTHVPDESFFQTAIMASPFKTTVINDYKRFIVMNPENDAIHPYIWNEKDYNFITNTNAFFCRKFDDSLDSKILDLLESRLIGG